LAAISYSVNGENDEDYSFGDNLDMSFGGSYQSDGKWGAGIDLRYRRSKRDRRNSVSIPNTGGEWLELAPSFQYHITRQLATTVSVRVPVWRDLNDALQFTTSYAYSLSLTYVMQRNSS
jgi:long-subunit fatty acid transport protein